MSLFNIDHIRLPYITATQFENDDFLSQPFRYIDEARLLPERHEMNPKRGKVSRANRLILLTSVAAGEKAPPTHRDSINLSTPCLVLFQ